MSKLEALKELREKLNVVIEGKDNYPKDYPSVIISNHNRLLDIFYVPMCIDDDIVSLVSSRLVYRKNDINRFNMVNKYLNGFPIEAHGGSAYSGMCIDYASKILASGNSVSIFPEGAYIDDRDNVYRGRTGAARILFRALDKERFSYLLPVSVDVKSNDDLDSYNPDLNSEITIRILEPINPYDYYYEYKKNGNDNQILHEFINKGMANIASSLNRNFINEYIELTPKNNVIFRDNTVIEKEEAKRIEYIRKYDKELHDLTLKLCNLKKY